MIQIDDQKRALSEAVGGRIRYYRHIKSLSQEQLALQAGLNPAYFGQVERGLKCPTIDTLYKIANALNITMQDLLAADIGYDHDAVYSQRLNALLFRVPKDKAEQVLRILEEIVKLW